MKKHVLSLFDASHRWWTLSFFLASSVLIITSMLLGINDNPPGFAMLFVGMIFLFFALVHPWRHVSNYVILIGICFGIILLILVGIGILKDIDTGKTDHNGDAIVMGLFFLVCLPGIVVGIIGSIICRFIND
jgi:hypothetical protein